MVSISTRRLPSTSIEATDWATAGQDTSMMASVLATGMTNIIRAATKPPRTPIPTFIRNLPWLFRVALTVRMWLKNLGSVSHHFESLLDGTKAHSALGLQAAFLMPISQLPAFHPLLHLEIAFETRGGKTIRSVSPVTLQVLFCGDLRDMIQKVGDPRSICRSTQIPWSFCHL